MRAGNWKRKCSVALAVCLVFSGLTLPGGTIRARASEKQSVAEEYQYTEDAVSGNNIGADDSAAAQTVSGNGAGAAVSDILFEDFEGAAGGSLPSGWKFGNPANSKAKASVQELGGNRVLVIDQSEDNSGANYNPSVSYALPREYSKVVLSYSVASKTTGGVMYLPTVANGGTRLAELSFNTYKGDFIKYQTAGDSTWHTIQAYEPLRWYSIKIVYEFKGDSADYTVYIDGRQAELEHPQPRNSKAVNGVNLNLYRKNTGTYYVDNIRITEQDHDPVKPGDLPDPEDPKPTGSVAYSQDFEAVAEGKLPSGWSASNMAETTTAGVQVVDGSRALVIDHPVTQAASMTIRYPFPGGVSTDRAVLKYRVKASQSSGALYLPSFYNNTAQLVKLAFNSGKIQKDNDGKGWVDIMSYETDTWYEVELMLDTKENCYDLYVNGQLVAAQEKPYASGPINRLGLGVYKTTANTFYLDDFEIKDYVEGISAAFSQETYEVVKGKTKQLNLVFTPEDTSRRSASFSSSDEKVATVNNLGVVTGVAEGTATITAVPSLTGLPSVTAQVTVTNVQPEKVVVSPESLTLPEGGHQFITASVEPAETGNPTVLFTSDNPSVAVVDEWGEVVAVGEGTAVVTAFSEEKPEVASRIPVTVTPRSVMMSIYVSPEGSDDGDGSRSGPVKTLQKAQELVRANNKNMTGDIEVVLADGYYLQTSTFALNEQDGGANNHYVVYRHEGDGKAVIGGKRDITNFNVYDPEKNIYVADAPNLETRQLYVDGVRAVRARSEEGLLSPVAWQVNGVNTGYTCANKEFLDYAHPEDLEFIFQEQWTNPRCGVSGVSADGDRVQVTMDQPGWKYVSDKGGTSASTPVYYENALELLDEPGEWYLDTHEGKIYYMPRPWEDMGRVSVTAPVVEELMTIQGTDYDNMVQNIEFKGITFADTTWNRPSTNYGHADAQNNHIREHGVPDRLPEAAVTVKRANSVRFYGCDFTRMGISALKMVEGVQNSPVVGNRFYDISGSAVNIGDPYTNNPDNYNPEDIRKIMKNCDVLNNYIHDIGVDYQSAAAISVGFAADMELSYNEIFNIPYSAFHIGYGWAKRFENVQRNMHIENNFIHDLMGDGIYDGGAIYFNGNSGGSEDNYNVVAGNYIRNQMDLNAPLYADEGTTYWRWEHNVVDLSESPLWHNNANPRWMLVYVPTIENLQVRDIYTTTSNKYVNEQAPNVSIADIHVHEDAVWPQAAQDIIAASGLQTVYAGLRADQAERLDTNVEGDEISVEVNGSFQVEVKAADGKERPVSLDHALVSYGVADSAIAQVTSEGLVKGIKGGITTLRIYVVSNGILDVVEKQIYVGDVFSRIGLEGVENNTVLLGETSKGVQLKPFGVTDLDRRVELENIEYSIENAAIAAVSEDGYVKPLSAGTTVLKVKADGEGRSVEQEFTLVIEAKQDFVADNIYEIFEKENADSWVVEGGSFDLAEGEQIVSTLSKYATFTGTKYRNELMNFKLKIDANGKGGWPSIVLRAQSSDKAVSGGATGYIICFGSSGLEVHRFTGSKRTVIFGSMDGYTSLGGPVITPEPLTHGEEHDVEVGALTNGDTVRLLLKIDGKTIFDFTDEEEDAITEPGYFGLVGRGETFTLTKDTSMPDVEEPDPGPGPDDGGDPDPGPDDGGDPDPGPGPDDGGDPDPGPGPDDGGDPDPGPDDGGNPDPGPDDGSDPNPGPDDGNTPDSGQNDGSGQDSGNNDAGNGQTGQPADSGKKSPSTYDISLLMAEDGQKAGGNIWIPVVAAAGAAVLICGAKIYRKTKEEEE